MIDMARTDSHDGWQVSVVIPTYNAEPYIARAIDSVLGQTLAADEIIVVDDGSTDATGDLVKAYGNQVRYIWQDNAGVSAARNVGIKAAKGDWIAFLDADDEWLPEKLEQQLGLLQRHPELVWTSGNCFHCFCAEDRRVAFVDPQKVKRALGDKEFFDEFFSAFIEYWSGWLGAALIRRDVLLDVGLFREGQYLSEDLDVWFRIAYHWPRVGFFPDPVAIHHRQVANSAMQRYKEEEMVLEMLERHLQLAADYGRLDAFRPCATHLLRYWIHYYLFDKRICYIRKLIVEFDDLLPSFYKSILRLLTIWPDLTSRCMPILSWVNRWVGLKI